MDVTELIWHSARQEAKGFRPYYTRSDLNEAQRDLKLPVFTIARSLTSSSSPRYTVTGESHHGHDNEPRMQFVCDFLKNDVLPYVDTHVDVSGHYRIELHDSYAYLPNAREYKNCLTFSRAREDTHLTLIPDAFQMGNYGGLFDANADTVPWDKKSDLAFFAGSSTGSRDPLENVRVQACRWSLLHPQTTSLRITNIVQMSKEEFCAKIPEWNKIVRPAVPLADNYKYKYLVNLPGNTCAWSRLPLIMASKSLMLNVYSKDITWYYPFLQEGTHFLGGGLHMLLAKRSFAAANPQITQYCIANANRFHNAFLGKNHAVHYMLQLLEEIAQRNQR